MKREVDMKKIIFVITCLLLAVGCGKYNEEDAYKELSEQIDSLTSYQLTGELLIYRGEDSYTYDVDVAYQKDDYYRVSLVNKVNNHEQIILRNQDGVYVLTPSLNKSFKFQSDWPYNNSQIYLLERIFTDLEKDDDRTLTQEGDGYIFTSKVTYSNNESLMTQKVYVDKDLQVQKIEVLDGDNVVQMCMTITNIDQKKTFDESYFQLESNMGAEQTIETTMSTIDSIVYPMYIPTNTYLTSQDKVILDDGERIILTFEGESPFMLVEETAVITEEMETSIIYGDPYLISDTIGAVTDYSVSWISNGVEYSLVSESLGLEEMMSVAESISVSAIAK